MKSDRTAIIVQGGAIKGAFGAGVLYGLSQIGVERVDLIIGTSSGAPTCACFATQQFEYIKRIWTEAVPTGKFVNYSNLLQRKPVFDLRYLIDTVFKKEFPINTNLLFESPTRCIIPAYDYEKGSLELFDTRSKELREHFWTILQAAMTTHAHSGVYGTSYEQLIDADIDPFSIYRREIIPRDWNVIVILNHKDLHNTWKRRLGIRIFRMLQSKDAPPQVRRLLKIRGELITTGLESFQKFVTTYDPTIISPSSDLRLPPTRLITRSKERIGEIFSAGERAVSTLDADSAASARLQPFIKRSRALGEKSPSYETPLPAARATETSLI